MPNFLDLTRAREQMKQDGIRSTDINDMPHIVCGNPVFDRINIDYAEKFDKEMKYFFPDEEKGYVMALHLRYHQVINNKTTGDPSLDSYIRNFNSYKAFVSYYKSIRIRQIAK